MPSYNDLVRADNDAKNMGGTKITLYYADWNDIATHAAIGTITNPEDKYILTTAPVFKSGKKWQKIEVALHSGKLTVESIGETDGKAFNIKPTFAVPLNNKKALPLFNSPNGLWVFGIPLANGNTVLVGNADFPAELKPSADGGDNKGNGGMFNFEIDCYTPELFFYTGAFTLTPAP